MSRPSRPKSRLSRPPGGTRIVNNGAGCSPIRWFVPTVPPTFSGEGRKNGKLTACPPPDRSGYRSQSGGTNGGTKSRSEARNLAFTRPAGQRYQDTVSATRPHLLEPRGQSDATALPTTRRRLAAGIDCGPEAPDPPESARCEMKVVLNQQLTNQTPRSTANSRVAFNPR